MTTAREEELRDRQRAYDEARSESPNRRDQIREARARYRDANKTARADYDAPRKDRKGEGSRRKKAARRIVGVDGEGLDFYACRRCGEKVTSGGGACAKGGKGGRHLLTYGCSTCGKRGVTHRTRCWEAKDGKHVRFLSADGHLYTYLAAVDERGKLLSEAHDPNGLTHQACAEMLLRLPKSAIKFGFMFSYDVTKIIEEMPPAARFYLMRPATREALVCKRRECGSVLPSEARECQDCGGAKVRKKTLPFEWKGRTYDFFNGSLTVSQMTDGKLRSAKVWDCFRFFGCAFVQALKDWSACFACGEGGVLTKDDAGYVCTLCRERHTGDPPVATVEQITRISGMKDKRGAFDVEDPEKVKAYCREECVLLARMMRCLIEAHEKAGIPLQRFDGAGSSATALLKAYNVADFKGPRHRDLDPELQRAVESAFFGGRFENSAIGTVEKAIHGYDISSAYPFGLTSLPCLGCGFWRKDRRLTPEKIRRVHKKGGLVVARFHVLPMEEAARRELAWGPLPFRSEEGSITYGTNFTGWAWGQELDAALRGWGDIVRLDGEAWIYEKRCDHQPFAFLPEVYRQRLKWGKEGAGKVLKLAMNACYGKLAQSIGDDPPFQSWIWAGAVTATTRGQLLDAIASAKDRWNVLAVATDGIFGLEELPLKAPPYDVGTSDLKKPLGGWEHKAVPQGAFFAKPGLYYSLRRGDPKVKAEGAFVRARGVGRREVSAETATLEAGFAAWDRKDVKYFVALRSRRFYGAKSSVYGWSDCMTCKKGFAGVRCPTCQKVGIGFRTTLVQTADGRDAYGTWDARMVKIAFDPHPKREREGLSRRGSFAYLRTRDLEAKVSKPYDVGMRTTTPEGQAAREGRELALEQPDWDG